MNLVVASSSLSRSLTIDLSRYISHCLTLASCTAEAWAREAHREDKHASAEVWLDGRIIGRVVYTGGSWVWGEC